MNKSSVGFIANIEESTLSNQDYRHVVYTAAHMQLVLMKLNPGEEIGMEVHENNDQFFRVEKGEIKVILNTEVNIVKEGMVLIVPAGTQHNIINETAAEAKLYTIYCPSVHPDGTIQSVKPLESE
jgi:mannose-6-phosphate isomerase-like protein (cupin superfamily)